MGRKDFNRKQCLRALRKLGFVKCSMRRGKHDKFIAPENLLFNKQEGQPSFIMIPRGKKLHCQLEILKELWAFSGDELIDKFLKSL